jgi:hypothetical protein
LNQLPSEVNTIARLEVQADKVASIYAVCINCNKRFTSMRAVSMHLKITAARHAVQLNRELRQEDSFTVGDFNVEVVVTSEEVFTKAKLRIHVEENFLNIRMKKLSRFEVLKYKFSRYRTVDS